MTDLRTAIRDREPVAGTWVAVGHPAVAELSAGLDFDFVTIDTEHAPTTLETVENMLRGVAAAPGETAAVVRAPWNDHVRLKRLLDCGPDGVMVPMVESASEAEAFVEATSYPPAGRRGLAAGRAADYGQRFESYVETADDSLLRVAQVETVPGIENAGEIAGVDGVDALLVGPADFSASVGAFGEFDDEAFTDAVGSVLDAAHDAGVAVGTLATDEDLIPEWVELGFDFLIVGTDLGYLADGATSAKARYEAALDE